MNERVRMQYLEAMGIEMFVPRWQMPCAKVSGQAVLPVAQEPSPPKSMTSMPTPEPALAGRVAGHEVVSDIVARLKEQVGEPTAVPKPGTKERDLRAAAVDEDEPLRFTLNVWSVNNRLMVVDSHQPRQALPTHSLLANMLFSKGVHKPIGAPEAVQWPAVNDIGGGLLKARDMVNAFLGARLGRTSATTLWLLGEDAFRVVAPTGKTYSDAVGKAFDIPELSVLALVLPSLSEILRDPSLKAQVWATVAPYGVSDE